MSSVRVRTAVFLVLVASFLVSGSVAKADPRLSRSVIQLAPEQPTPALQPGPAPQPPPEVQPLPSHIPAAEPRAVIYPHCYWKPLYQCIVAPYDCKPGVCAPPCGYGTVCDKYCGKPLPCPPGPCEKWCPGCYSPKPPVKCYPGNPCPPCETTHRCR